MMGEFGGIVMINAIKTAKMSQNQCFCGDKQVMTSDKNLISGHAPILVSAMSSHPEGASP